MRGVTIATHRNKEKQTGMTSTVPNIPRLTSNNELGTCRPGCPQSHGGSSQDLAGYLIGSVQSRAVPPCESLKIFLTIVFATSRAFASSSSFCERPASLPSRSSTQRS